MISQFHFLRPWFLLALIPCLLLYWLIHSRQDPALPWRGVIAPHLLPFLLGGQVKEARFTPLHLIGMGWLVTVLAMAGPTWERKPAPFSEDTAALAVVVKVTPSMATEDLQPSRLARAVQKIQELLIQRRGGKTALIAYSGTSHRVMPATTDEGIINIFAEALDPKLMPVEGDDAAQALRLADQTLIDAGGGSILWIADDIAGEQHDALMAWRKASKTAVRLLPPLLKGPELDAVSVSAKAVGASIVRLTPDDEDVRQLASAAKFSNATGSNDRWVESGYWLSPLLALILLPFFRRGWAVLPAAR